MSEAYDLYLQEHKSNLLKGYCWFEDNLPEIFKSNPQLMTKTRWQIEYNHDTSKSDKEEYEAYDEYFYGRNKSYSVVQNYKKAWLHHIHNNPHHWQYWIIINDDPKEGMTILDMPDNYILEMICDWWSFSMKTGKLTEIFDWYEERKNYIKLHPNSRKTLESILGQIKIKLEEQNNDV